jgi:hypothetical protein
MSPPVRDSDSNNNTSLFKFTNLLGTPDPGLDFSSLISEAKPAAILVNECGDVESQMNKDRSYFYAYELVFQTDDESKNDVVNRSGDHSGSSQTMPATNTGQRPDMINLSLDKLCCFAETKDGSLLLATEKG